MKVGANIRTPEGKIAAPSTHINNVHAPSVDDNVPGLEPPSLRTVDPAGCHPVSQLFALGDQLTIAFSLVPSGQPLMQRALLLALASRCHPKLPCDLAYSFP